MFRKTLIFSGILALPIAIGLVGCGRSATSGTPSKDAQHADHADHEHADHDHAHHHEGDETKTGAQEADIKAAFAELSGEDRLLAERQKICPVSGELLGSMGAPIKIDVKGQPVFICCEGCKDDLLAKPDEFLAKLKK